MKKITILALHLGYGGIERAITTFANMFADEYDITIVSTYKLYDKPAFSLSPKIKIEYLLEKEYSPNREKAKEYLKHFHFIKLAKELIKAKKILKLKKDKMIDYIKNCDSDIIISTRDIHNLWLSLYGREDAYKIGWEHNHHNNNQKYIDTIVDSAKDLDAFVLVSKDLYAFYQEALKDEKCACYYIPNCIDFIPETASNVKSNHIITIGRLSKEKGHLDLIDVMKQLKGKEDFHLDIVGAGAEEEKIKEAILSYDLSDSITMHGFLNKEQMAPILEKASVFVLPSYTESFGLVILEAFAYGVPAVAFDSAQGAREIIENGWDGYLVKDRDKVEMAKRITELLKSYNRRVVMGNNALKKAKKYTTDVVKNDWEDLLKNEK